MEGLTAQQEYELYIALYQWDYYEQMKHGFEKKLKTMAVKANPAQKVYLDNMIGWIYDWVNPMADLCEPLITKYKLKLNSLSLRANPARAEWYKGQIKVMEIFLARTKQ